MRLRKTPQLCERSLVAACHAAGVPVKRNPPRRVRDFARARGRLAKTDRIDAMRKLLAHLNSILRNLPLRST